MQNLPIELNYEIGNYLFTCKKNPLYINKEFTDIFKYKTKKCKEVKISRKTYCQNCEKKQIWRARMIMNNLLTG
jgi:hypothetical protein|tara:strand:+ start:67 stop:288 length:222 start_codon:yes stop_codon:yes gene_type:complete